MEILLIKLRDKIIDILDCFMNCTYLGYEQDPDFWDKM